MNCDTKIIIYHVQPKNQPEISPVIEKTRSGICRWVVPGGNENRSTAHCKKRSGMNLPITPIDDMRTIHQFSS